MVNPTNGAPGEAGKEEDIVALLAARRGLARALAEFPAAVRGAAARGLQPLPPAPEGPLTEPAGVFAAGRAVAGER